MDVKLTRNKDVAKIRALPQAERFSALKSLVEKRRKQLSVKSEELRELIGECTHQETVEKSLYVEGSYYDKAYTKHYTCCALCNKEMKSHIENHSWYG